MKTIYTKHKQEILVDDEDYIILNQWRWSVNSQGYVIRSVEKDTIRWCVRMHRQVLGLGSHKVGELDIDHINRNKLDNRKENLRFISHSDNVKNRDSFTYLRKGKLVFVRGIVRLSPEI